MQQLHYQTTHYNLQWKVLTCKFVWKHVCPDSECSNFMPVNTTPQPLVLQPQKIFSHLCENMFAICSRVVDVSSHNGPAELVWKGKEVSKMAGRVRICTLYRHICDNCLRSRYIFTSSKRTDFKIDTDWVVVGFGLVGPHVCSFLPPCWPWLPSRPSHVLLQCPFILPARPCSNHPPPAAGI